MSWPLYLGEEIKELLPQREPFLMVDVLYDCSSTECRTGMNIYPDNIFCDGGIFTAEGVMEHMAQSGSVLLGCNAVHSGVQAPAGYIGEIRKFRMARHPHTYQALSTCVTIGKEVNGIYLISVKTKVKNDPVAECQMKLSVASKQ